jgi:hypothetical protein
MEAPVPDPIDLRWITAMCQILTGMLAVTVVIVTWWMTPHDRAKRFGPYLTGEGLRAFLTNLPNALLFGLFLIVSGTSKWAFYDSATGGMSSQSAITISMLEALFGSIFVAILVWKTIRAA